MGHRYWKLHTSMGFVGTDDEKEIDLVKYWGISEAEIKEMTDEYIKKELDVEAYEQAYEKFSAWAEPKH